MSLESHFCLLAEYNQWMNLKVYESAGRLSREDLTADRGAFFRSVLGTLNHIVVADFIWLKRFATHPSCGSLLREIVDLSNPASLDHILYDDFEALSERRYWLDEQIIKLNFLKHIVPIGNMAIMHSQMKIIHWVLYMLLEIHEMSLHPY